MPSSFDLKKASNAQFMFNLRAENSEIILTSETYTVKASAENGIRSARTNATKDDRYNRKISGSQYYFTLEGANGEIIGTSERYTSTAARDNGIASVKKNAPTAPVKDLT